MSIEWLSDFSPQLTRLYAWTFCLSATYGQLTYMASAPGQASPSGRQDPPPSKPASEIHLVLDTCVCVHVLWTLGKPAGRHTRGLGASWGIRVRLRQILPVPQSQILVPSAG